MIDATVQSPDVVRPCLNAVVRGELEPLLDDLREDKVYQQVVAVVLCGSAARGEERRENGRIVSDLDIMVITRTASPLVGRRIAKVMQQHRERHLEGGQVPIRTLALHRTLLNFEASCTGVVVDGAPDVLRRIAVRSPADIPRWEAIRLLFNRLMEHVKMYAGQASAQSVYGKTYEALAEACLVMEWRYRPTYRGRLVELQRSPARLMPDLNPAFIEVLGERLANRTTTAGDTDRAQADLKAGLTAVLNEFLGQTGPLELQLNRVSRRYRHLKHRLYWITQHVPTGDPALRVLREDPSFTVWRQGLAATNSPIDVRRAQTIVRSWERCPQILDSKA